MRQETRTVLTPNDRKLLILSIVENNPVSEANILYPKFITSNSHWQISFLRTLLQDINLSPVFPGRVLLDVSLSHFVTVKSTLFSTSDKTLVDYNSAQK